MKKDYILIIMLALVVVSAVALSVKILTHEKTVDIEELPLVNEQVNNFQECVDAGFPVMESYPRQCRDGQGKLHVEVLDNLNEIENGNIEIANPASTYCLDQGGELELRENEDGGQVGYCVFENGNECEEWLFYRGECEQNN